jgi:ketosteroid isomerase-like protein
MSQNVELLRRIIEANRSDEIEAGTETIVALSDPSFEFRSVLSAVEGATYRGHDGVRRYLSDMADAWQEWRNDADEILEIGPDTVLVNLHFRAVGHSGTAVEAHSTAIFVFSNGKCLSIHSYPTRAAALEDVGLRE